jgi:hypothetical protein
MIWYYIYCTLYSFEMWCWRRMEKISWTNHVRNEVLLWVKEQRNILHEISKRKANCIGHILCRNCLLQQVIEGKIKGGIEVTGRRGRRRKKQLDDLKERRGYWHLKEEPLDRAVCRTHFGSVFGPVVRQTAKWMVNERWRERKCHIALNHVTVETSRNMTSTLISLSLSIWQLLQRWTKSLQF